MLKDTETYWKHQSPNGSVTVLCNDHSDARLHTHPDDDVELWSGRISSHGAEADRERRCYVCRPRRK